MPAILKFAQTFAFVNLSINQYRFWQRLEPRARADDFTKSIQAQIRDPLWMLGRQWQLGEFKGEDAGSPVQAKLVTERTKINLFQPGEYGSQRPVSQLNNKQPLETNIEKEPVIIDHRISVQIGLQFEKELKEQGVSDDVLDNLREEFMMETLSELSEEEKLEYDDSTIDFIEFFSGKVINGEKLIKQEGLVNKTPQINDELSNILNGEDDKVISALEKLREWYESLFENPLEKDDLPWNNNRFEYEFTSSAPKNNNKGQYVLEVPEFRGGELDWPDFSIIRAPSAKLNPSDDSVPNTFNKDDPVKFIPTNIVVQGAPDHRWWAFEDRKIDFGSLDVKTTDIGKLLLMEFALIHGNDWYQIPVPLEVGSICKVASLEVTDVFGNSYNIPRAGFREDLDWQRWDMFTLSYKKNRDFSITNGQDGNNSADLFFLPPALGRNENGPPLEEVRFLRDEMANKVWAVEHHIMNGIGKPISGFEYWRDYNKRIEEKKLRNQLPELCQIFISKILALLSNAVNKVINYEKYEAIKENLPIIKDIVDFVQTVSDTSDDNMESVTDNLYKWYIIILPILKQFESFKNANNDPDLLKVKVVYRMLEPSISALKQIIPSFKKARLETTFELLKSSVENIKSGLKSLLSSVDLTVEEKSLIGMEKETEQENVYPQYRLMSKVPENWIPYIPIHIGGQNRQIQLQQASMFRNDSAGNYDAKPMSRILKYAAENNQPHFIDEETVARHALKIRMHAQRTRWIDGSTHVWISRKVGPGRGEGSSGLKFDYLKVVENK